MGKRYTDLQFLIDNTSGNSAYISELIELYLTTTPVMVAELKKFHKSGDRESLRKVAHKLKSNLHTMGVADSYEAIGKLELLPEPANKDENIASLVEFIDEVVGFSYLELKEELKTLKNK